MEPQVKKLRRQDCIQVALEGLKGGKVVVLLREKAPAIKAQAIDSASGRPNEAEVVSFAVDEPISFQSIDHRQVGDNGWEFRIQERGADNKLVTLLCYVRSQDILMVRSMSALEG